MVVMVVMSVFACRSLVIMARTVLAVAMSPMTMSHMTNPLRVPHHRRHSVLINSLPDLSENLDNVLLHHGVGGSCPRLQLARSEIA